MRRKQPLPTLFTLSVPEDVVVEDKKARVRLQPDSDEIVEIDFNKVAAFSYFIRQKDKIVDFNGRSYDIYELCVHVYMDDGCVHRILLVFTKDKREVGNKLLNFLEDLCDGWEEDWLADLLYDYW